MAPTEDERVPTKDMVVGVEQPKDGDVGQTNTELGVGVEQCCVDGKMVGVEQPKDDGTEVGGAQNVETKKDDDNGPKAALGMEEGGAPMTETKKDDDIGPKTAQVMEVVGAPTKRKGNGSGREGDRGKITTYMIDLQSVKVHGSF